MDACISTHNFLPSSFTFLYCRFKMRRTHILFPLLLLCLMLMASQEIYATSSSTFQETKTGNSHVSRYLNQSCYHLFSIKGTCFNKDLSISGGFKMATAAYNSGNARGNSQKVEVSHKENDLFCYITWHS